MQYSFLSLEEKILEDYDGWYIAAIDLSSLQDNYQINQFLCRHVKISKMASYIDNSKSGGNLVFFFYQLKT